MRECRVRRPPKGSVTDEHHIAHGCSERQLHGRRSGLRARGYGRRRRAAHPPSNVQVLAVSRSTVTISFTGSTDDVGLKWYVVRVGNREQATTSPSSTQVGGLFSNTSYSVTVVADISSWSRSGQSIRPGTAPSLRLRP
jgi:Fibronectin type III domain